MKMIPKSLDFAFKPFPWNKMLAPNSMIINIQVSILLRTMKKEKTWEWTLDKDIRCHHMAIKLLFVYRDKEQSREKKEKKEQR
jgi:hypothetical protein